MKRIITCCLAMVVLVGCAKDQKESPAATGPKPSLFQEQKQTITATVAAIDYPTRMVTLRGETGNELTFKASDEVRNLDRVKVGDRVAVDYYESVAIHVQPPGEAINDVRVATERAEPGEKPGGMVAKHTTRTATVEKLDKSAGTATLRGPDGNLRTITARDRKNLENVNVGDRVVVTYTEKLAVGMRPAPAP
jgi:hypothetical protein